MISGHDRMQPSSPLGDLTPAGFAFVGRDAASLAWLMEQGASQQAVAE